MLLTLCSPRLSPSPIPRAQEGAGLIWCKTKRSLNGREHGESWSGCTIARSGPSQQRFKQHEKEKAEIANQTETGVHVENNS